jgi:hypothetical protein
VSEPVSFIQVSSILVSTVSQTIDHLHAWLDIGSRIGERRDHFLPLAQEKITILSDQRHTIFDQLLHFASERNLEAFRETGGSITRDEHPKVLEMAELDLLECSLFKDVTVLSIQKKGLSVIGEEQIGSDRVCSGRSFEGLVDEGVAEEAHADLDQHLQSVDDRGIEFVLDRPLVISSDGILRDDHRKGSRDVSNSERADVTKLRDHGRDEVLPQTESVDEVPLDFVPSKETGDGGLGGFLVKQRMIEEAVQDGRQFLLEVVLDHLLLCQVREWDGLSFLFLFFFDFHDVVEGSHKQVVASDHEMEESTGTKTLIRSSGKTERDGRSLFDDKSLHFLGEFLAFKGVDLTPKGGPGTPEPRKHIVPLFLLCLVGDGLDDVWDLSGVGVLEVDSAVELGAQHVDPLGALVEVVDALHLILHVDQQLKHGELLLEVWTGVVDAQEIIIRRDVPQSQWVDL